MKHYFATLTLLFCTLFVYSQHSKLNSQIELGGLRGIQLSKSFPILKSGGIAQLNVSRVLSDYVSLGLGVAYIQLTDYLDKLFSLYPNHSKDYFQLEMHTDMQVDNITILNAMGQSVYSHNDFWNKPIDIRKLATGVYVLQVRFEERLYNERFLVH
tara:strand:- start:1015 stop:1482 length:468 start_codon:yes stop_codon:yes gene_type:complete